jgi:hypothetical protein
MKKLLIFSLVCVAACGKKHDHHDFETGLVRNIQKAKSAEQKLTCLSRLAWYYMDTDRRRSDSTMGEAYAFAESTKDNGILILAYLFDAQRHLLADDYKHEMEAVYELAQKASDLAKSGNYTDYVAYSDLYKAHSARKLGNFQAAEGYLSDAGNIVKDTKSDSLRIEYYYLHSQVSQDKRDVNQALDDALQVRRIAEQSKNKNLKLMAYLRLGIVYEDIDSVKARENYKDLAALSRSVGDVEQLIAADLWLGKLYSNQKEFARESSKYLHNAMDLAQQINHQNLIVQAHIGLINYYLNTRQADSVVDYLDKNTTELNNYYLKNGHIARFYYRYGSFYYNLGRNYRSSGNEEQAYNCFSQAMTYLWKSDSVYYPNAVASRESDLCFYGGASNYYLYFLNRGTSQDASGYFGRAIRFFNITKDLARQISNPQFMRNVFSWMEYLYKDSAEYYARYIPNNYFTNPVPTVNYYQLAYSSRRAYDSCDFIFRNLTSQIERIRIENDDKAKTAEINKIRERQKESLKFIGITVGLAMIFLVLILTGFFRVSEFWIRLLGVFAFLCLFEFIVLIIDRQLHEFTHGELVSLLLIKVVIAAILSPIHHLLEKRVIRSLTRRKLLREDAKRLKGLAERTKEERLS